MESGISLAIVVRMNIPSQVGSHEKPGSCVHHRRERTFDITSCWGATTSTSFSDILIDAPFPSPFLLPFAHVFINPSENRKGFIKTKFVYFVCYLTLVSQIHKTQKAKTQKTKADSQKSLQTNKKNFSKLLLH